jgi:hypothetical protein
MATGVQSMVRLAVKGTSWSHLLDYLSPALFDVMPARDLIKQGRELMANRSDAERFEETRRQVVDELASHGIEVHLAGEQESTERIELADLDSDRAREVGQRILSVYFGQIFLGERAILDLRSRSFMLSKPSALHWHPSALYIEWEPRFLEAIRDLYVGFYLEDEGRFQRALATLDMEDSADALGNLLGRDDPRNAHFESAAFHAHFHEMFVSYRDNGTTLHRNFLALGVYLLCLYDALESLGGSFDIRAAVERASGATTVDRIATAS